MLRFQPFGPRKGGSAILAVGYGPWGTACPPHRPPGPGLLWARDHCFSGPVFYDTFLNTYVFGGVFALRTLGKAHRPRAT